MSSKTCVEALIKWTTDNYNSLPKRDRNFVGEKRLKVLEQGHTRSSNWKRRAIKKHNDTTYRLFECKQTLFKHPVMFLVVENSQTITVTLGTRRDFEKYFDTTGYSWGGWT